MICNDLLFFFLFWQKRKKQRKLPFSQRRTRGVSRAATTLNRSLQYGIPIGIVVYAYSALAMMRRETMWLDLEICSKP
jgi:hypothetical protein